jgi:hypothetical protein
MVETIFALAFLLAAVLAYIGHKRKWKISEYL